MRLPFILIAALVELGAVPAIADPIDQVIARLNALEKRNEALAQENAALKQRVSRLENASSETVAEKQPTASSFATKDIVTTSTVVPTSSRYDAASTVRGGGADAAFNWTGAYAGIHGGGAWGVLDFSDTVPTVPFVVETFRGDLDASGGLGGVQVGANKQFGNWVVGAELSMSGARISGSQPHGCLLDPVFGFDAECKARVNWLMTGLARLGYTHDRWLVTGSAGWSVAGAEYDYVFDAGVRIPSGSNETLDGFTYGAGFNYALNRSVSLGVEYLHADLSADGPAFLGPLIGIGKGERDMDLNIGRAQLNVKLGE